MMSTMVANDDPGQASLATDPRVVAEQAGMVAAAWSPPGAPASWELTAAQFAALRDDPDLAAIAATIPPDRLPPLLFSAAAAFLVLDEKPHPLRDVFPRLGEPQPPLNPGFGAVYREFCLDRRDRLHELCVSHRYQMNEVGRCSGLIPALAPAFADGRELALVDVGTGAGLALHLDHYRYKFVASGGAVSEFGDRAATAIIETTVRGFADVPMPSRLPSIAERIGIDVEPLDVRNPAVRSWLAACIPQEIGAVTRFNQAVELVLQQPVQAVRGDACEVLPQVLKSIPPHALICLLDTFVAVFFEPDELAVLRALVDRAGAERDLDWISIDPLVPMGTSASDCVTGADVPREVIERNRDEGVFGVISRVSYRNGERTRTVLGLAHPGAAWLEWLD
jgi:hypothetical protein